MSDWISWYTFFAFILGVIFSATVKALFSQLRGKVTGAASGG